MTARERFCRAAALALLAVAALPAASVAFSAPPNGEALLNALRDADEALAARLIDAHADVNFRDETGATPLLWAAQRRNLGLVARLLKARANPDILSENGLGPLQAAIANRAGDIAVLLIDSGAKVNIARQGGETALMTAARTGQLDVMTRLIAKGANVNAHEDKFNQTALMWSAGYPGQVKLLIEHGADVHAHTRTWHVTNTIYTPITATVGVTGIPWNHDGEFVSEAGGESALFFAVQNDDLESTQALMDAGLDVNDAAADGSTALLLALYKWGWGNGDTAHLHAPRYAPNLSIANLLLDRGANVGVTNAEGYTPLHGAVLSLVPQPRLVPNVRVGDDTVASAKPPVDPTEGMSVVNRLLDKGSDPNAMTQYPTPGPISDVRINPAPPGSTPLHIAALSGDAHLAETLLAHGGDPNLTRQDGHSPLSVAVKINDLSMVTMLVDHGGDVKRIYNPGDQLGDPVKPLARARSNQSILHIAAAAGSFEVINFLAEHGAPLNSKNDKGETPLDLADAQERFRYARATEDPALLRARFGDELKSHVTRETATSDAIKKITGARTASKAPASGVSGF